MKTRPLSAIPGSESNYPMHVFNILCVIGILASLAYPVWDTFFSGHLTPDQVAGEYVFESDGIREIIHLARDMKFVQRLRTKEKEYQTEGASEIQGGSIVFRPLYTIRSADGAILDPPEKRAVGVASWENSGSIRFQDMHRLKKK